MKQVVLSVGLLSLGLAVGLVVPGVFAQAPQAEVQKWEQFCERYSGTGRKPLDKANASAAAHGENGYQLVSLAWPGDYTYCYRRPAR